MASTLTEVDSLALTLDPSIPCLCVVARSRFFAMDHVQSLLGAEDVEPMVLVCTFLVGYQALEFSPLTSSSCFSPWEPCSGRPVIAC